MKNYESIFLDIIKKYAHKSISKVSITELKDKRLVDLEIDSLKFVNMILDIESNIGVNLLEYNIDWIGINTVYDLYNKIKEISDEG
ncbi:TPA: hypothetical protein ACUOCD_000020 [Streptococcus pneumoniae]|jgi:hypothetical protein|uniref:hypothetical protein n=1 Tax=Streptococcus parasanguinis TaxID=1318 RepID=UPI001CBD7E28|nr:hypothetical protein [Streptococcus parasanguinis]MBZ2090313.1 hypothetical protein [Streptococcus parasanguinis]